MKVFWIAVASRHWQKKKVKFSLENENNVLGHKLIKFANVMLNRILKEVTKHTKRQHKQEPVETTSTRFMGTQAIEVTSQRLRKLCLIDLR